VHMHMLPEFTTPSNRLKHADCQCKILQGGLLLLHVLPYTVLSQSTVWHVLVPRFFGTHHALHTLDRIHVFAERRRCLHQGVRVNWFSWQHGSTKRASLKGVRTAMLIWDGRSILYAGAASRTQHASKLAPTDTTRCICCAIVYAIVMIVMLECILSHNSE